MELYCFAVMYFNYKKAAFFLLSFILLSLPAFADNLEKGEIVPSLNILDLRDQPIKLSYLFQPKPKIIIFFTSWSKSCQKAIGYLDQLYVKNPEKIQVLAISFDQNSEALNKYLKETKPTLTLLKDPKLTSTKSYRILIIPSIFIVGIDNKLLELFVDFDESTPAKIEEIINPFLN